MKAIRKISLAILLCLFGLTALASCGNNAEAETILSKILLIQEGEDVDADFTVPGIVVHNSQQYEIAWTSSNEKVLSFEKDEENPSKVTADIHRPFDQDTDVTLKASIKGQKKPTVSFKTTVVKIDKEKALEAAIENVGVNSSYLEAATVELPATSNEYAEEITFAYELDGTYTSTTLTGNTLAMDPALASENVGLKVTATCGETVVNKTLTIAVTGALFAEGMPYVLRLYQGKLEKDLYLTSEMSGYYAKTTDDPALAEAVYLEAAEGGYHMYFLVDGNKSYINVVPSGTYRNLKFEAAASSVWNLNNKYNTLTTLIEGEEYYIGAYNSYETVGPSAISYAETSFPLHLEVGIGKAYSMYSVQGNVEKTLYLTGEMSGYYAKTTEDASLAADIYFEKATDGYYMYILNGEAKSYINVVPSGTYRNIKFEATASSVWNINSIYNTFSTFIEGEEYYLGTYGTYETVGPSAISYAETSFPCHMGVSSASGNRPTAVEVPEEAVKLTVSSDPVIWVNTGENTNVTEHMTDVSYATITAYKNSWAANPEYSADTQGYFYISKSDCRLYAASEGNQGGSLEIKLNGYDIVNLYMEVSSGEVVVLVNGQAVTLSEGTTNLYVCNASTVVIQNQGTKVAKIASIAFTTKSAHVHEYDTEWSSDATNHWHECACGGKTDVAAHTFGDWTTVTPAGNGACGSEERVCACGYKETRATHSVSTEWSSDATNHWHASTCACEEKHDTATHTFGEWTEVTPATESVDGVKERECTVCGYTEEGVIPSLGHTHSYDLTTWHYTDGTGHYHKCGCGEADATVPHTFGDWTEVEAPTISEEGLEERVCECGYKETQAIPVIEVTTVDLNCLTSPTFTDTVNNPDVSVYISESPLFTVVANKNDGSTNLGLYYDCIRLYPDKTAGNGNSLVITALPGVIIQKVELDWLETYDDGEKTGVVPTILVNGQPVTGNEGVFLIGANSFEIKNADTAGNQARITAIKISYSGEVTDLTDANDYQIYMLSEAGTQLEGISGKITEVGANYIKVRGADLRTYYVTSATTLAGWETKFMKDGTVTIPSGVKGVDGTVAQYLISDLSTITVVAPEVFSVDDFYAAEDDTELPSVTAVITAVTIAGNNYALADFNGRAILFYQYSSTISNELWVQKFVKGNKVTVENCMKDSYRGLNYIVVASMDDVTVEETGCTVPANTDITTIVAGCADADALKTALATMQGTLITITGTYDGSGIKPAGGAVSLAYYYDYKYLSSAPTVTMVSGSTYTVTGFLSWFNNPQIIPLTSDAITAN